MDECSIEHLLTPQQAAKILGITPRKLAELRREGRIGHYRLSRKTVRYSPEHVQALQREVRVRRKEVSDGTRHS